MGTTQWRGYPRVDTGDPPDIKGIVNALADDVDVDVQKLATGYRIADILHYTSSGTFQKGLYTDMRAVLVECVGGGGGSGFVANSSSSNFAAGRGGAGGAYTRSWFAASSLASSETVTVGAGGTGGTSGTPNGGNGGSTSFGSLVTAGGGQGGQAVAATAPPYLDSGAAATGGDPSGTFIIGVEGEDITGITYSGGPPSTLVDWTGLEGGAAGGPYGRSQRRGSTSVATNPLAGKGVGSGARGGWRFNTGSTLNGAAGSAGLVIVTVFI